MHGSGNPSSDTRVAVAWRGAAQPGPARHATLRHYTHVELPDRCGSVGMRLWLEFSVIAMPRSGRLVLLGVNRGVSIFARYGSNKKSCFGGLVGHSG